MSGRAYGGIALLLVVIASSCDAVPTLTFSDAGSNASDASAGEASSSEGGCPDQVPPGATTCCGSVPCAGDCDAHCADCEAKCPAVGNICCARNTVTCHTPGSGFVCN